MSERPLRDMLVEKGFATPFERGVELWKMFHRVYEVMQQISREIEDTAKEADRT